jgi:hypothetical protein
MVSLIYKNRAIPVYYELLDKKGNSIVQKQIEVLSKIIPLFKNYNVPLQQRLVTFASTPAAKYRPLQGGCYAAIAVDRSACSSPSRKG